MYSFLMLQTAGSVTWKFLILFENLFLLKVVDISGKTWIK